MIQNDQIDDILEYSSSIYESCNHLGATPRDYINFLNTWESLHEIKKKEIQNELSHLMGGLSKLQEASDTVDDLSKNAKVKKKELAEAQIAADDAMDQITAALSQASDNRKEVEEWKKELAIAEKESQNTKLDIEEELSSIAPILEKAKAAVGNLK